MAIRQERATDTPTHRMPVCVGLDLEQRATPLHPMPRLPPHGLHQKRFTHPLQRFGVSDWAW